MNNTNKQNSKIIKKNNYILLTILILFIALVYLGTLAKFNVI